LLALVPDGRQPGTLDSAFTWELFQSAVNRDLADVLGNFVNRIAKFCETRSRVVPEGGEAGPLEQKLYSDVAAQLADLSASSSDRDPQERPGAEALWVLGNEYLQAAAPWTAIKSDPARAAAVVRTR